VQAGLQDARVLFILHSFQLQLIECSQNWLEAHFWRSDAVRVAPFLDALPRNDWRVAISGA
jgi:hypothetical protein